jgi:hypothetical protein
VISVQTPGISDTAFARNQSVSKSRISTESEAYGSDIKKQIITGESV